MFAVVRTGGKQYKIAENDVITVERLAAEAGATVTLDDVLMLGAGAEVTLGAPAVSGASVSAEVLDQVRGDKIVVFKKKRRKGYRRTRGHRQDLTVLRITAIAAPGAAKKPATAKAETQPAAEKTKAKTKPAAARAKPQTAAKSKTKPAAKPKPKPAAKRPTKAKAAATKEKD